MMDPSGHPDLVTSPEITMPDNLEILARTAASKSNDDSASFSGFPVLKIGENTNIQLPLLSQHIRIEGQPGGPMLSQAQLHKILNTSEHEKRMSPGPLSIITTTSLSEAGQPSPASLSHGSQILYQTTGASGDAMLSAINYNENEILNEGGFDVSSNLGTLDDSILAGIGNPGRLNENPANDTFGLFGGESDSLNMDALSPNMLISDPAALTSVGVVSDSGDSSIADSSSKDDDRKKQGGKFRGKVSAKGQVSPGKVTGPLECNQCHKTFNNTSALAKHKLTHSDERKYLCTICEKKFKRQDHLNGHLMTHRDKKPYQCMVAGCEKSYCDARSLKRHLDNYHHHSNDQIAVEMVAAASKAAAVLADASNALPSQATQKSTITGLTSSGSGSKPTHSSPVIQNSAKSGVTTGPSTVASDNKVLAQQLMLTPNVNSTVSTLVTMGMTLPVTKAIDELTTVSQYETLLKQQQSQQNKQDVIKLDPAQIEALKQMQLKDMEIQAIAAAAQLHEEQQKQLQQQQQQQQSMSEPSPVSSMHAHSTEQSPVSGEMSPSYSEMSPVSHQAMPTSPIRSPAQAWYGFSGQGHTGTPAPNTTVADVKTSEGDPAKPVVCTICQRRFKNVPALNGHMRLHGGYFKKDAALKEEKRRKADMAPPSTVPSKTGASVSSPQAATGKKSKGTPPLQSPPSEELHALHWQQKQEQQRKQQQQQQQQQQIHHLQQQQQQTQQQQVVPKQSPPQTVQEHLKQIHQKMQQQEQQHQLQQQQQQLQAQLDQRLLEHQQQQQQQQQQIGQLEIIPVAQLQQAVVESPQIDQLRQQLIQQFQQQQQQQQQQQEHDNQIQQQHQQQQIVYDNTPQGHDQHNPYQNSAQLPTSPQYNQHTHSVPLSPQVPQSPLVQRQGSVEPLQSPVAEYSNQNILQENINLVHQFSEQRVPGYTNIQGTTENTLLHGLQQQIHAQNLNSIQGVNVGNVTNTNIPNSISGNVSNQLQQMVFEQAVNPSNEQSAYQSQLSGQFLASSGHLGNPEVPGSLAGSADTTSEIVSQIITSLESLGEVPPGSMQQIHKSEQDLHLQQVYSADNIGMEQFEHRLPPGDNGMLVKNSYSEFAHNNVVHNQVAAGFNQHFAALNPTSVCDTKASVKQELLKHLQSKPSSPRAAQSQQFSFQSNSNNASNNNGQLHVRQRHQSAKEYMSPQIHQSPVNNNSELKRRLSAGPEDIRSPVQTSVGNELRTYHKRGTIRPEENFKPRMRSKSGDDYKFQRWRNEEMFMKPKIRNEDFAHRPRSKTDENLAKWRNRDVFSRSDGAGVFRNPTSTAPGSFKMRRKNRPAPLIIPPHANMCGFQSRLRSPRIWAEGVEGSNTAPVPYTPPPMLSPLRRGSGLFSSIHGNLTPQPLPPQSAGPPSTPRPSLLRTASVQKTEESSDDTIPFPEELPPPESDIQPHVNIGPAYQAALPECNPHKKMALYDISKEDLVFDPSCLGDNAEDDLQSYQDLACSAAVSGNGFNVEHALHLLCIANGNIQKAMLMLMSGSCHLPRNHPLTTYKYQESDIWTGEEIDRYTQAILKHDKDFYSVSLDVKTKTVRQCVQFYYLWKKVLVDDHKRLRAIRRRREQDYNLRSTRQQGETQEMLAENGKAMDDGRILEEGEGDSVTRDLPVDDDDSLSEASTSVGTFDDHNVKELEEDAMEIPIRIPSPAANNSPMSYTCDYADCNSSFASKAALSAHVKIHVKVTKPSQVVPRYERKPSPSRSPHNNEQQEEAFPCKICGRVFAKVKSRSAHMKIHRPDQDKEKEKKAKLAKQQAAAAAAAAATSSIDPVLVDPMSYPALPNGPSQL